MTRKQLSKKRRAALQRIAKERRFTKLQYQFDLEKAALMLGFFLPKENNELSRPIHSWRKSRNHGANA